MAFLFVKEIKRFFCVRLYAETGKKERSHTELTMTEKQKSADGGKLVSYGNGFIKNSQKNDKEIMLSDEKIRNALQMLCWDDIVIVVFV